MPASTQPVTIHTRWLLNPGLPPLANRILQIQSGKITALGPANEFDVDLHIDHHVQLLTPGLINAHTHLDLSGGQPIHKHPDEPMSMWLLKVTESREPAPEKTLAQLTLERSIQGAQRMLQTGVTCVNDITQTTAPLKALEQTGLRGVVSLEYFHPGFAALQLDRLYHLYEQEFSPYQAHNRIRLGLSPHAPYNVSPAAWLEAAKHLSPSIIHSHVAECADERDWLLGIKPNGIDGIHRRFLNTMFTPQPCTPFNKNSNHSPEWQYLNNHGLLNSNVHTLLAHGSLLTPADLEALVGTPHTYLVHCPISNLFLHDVTLNNIPTTAMERLSIGTDSGLSHPTLDIRDDARKACKLHGWNAQTALTLMTQNAARALNWNNAIGKLALGYQADMVAWQRPQPDWHETLLHEQWLEPECLPETTWVQGHRVYHAQNAYHIEPQEEGRAV